eukprot:TRINITY_DN21470_c0_g1_i1.p1 TRINITY_DN21470_c0_g1~~TRINITY_DN21470_c0_g1_i1.p1  ORF type:complete len:353 (-),score=87.81 TRINITY_DN21470_c0_g1_i1:263-1321(-)
MKTLSIVNPSYLYKPPSFPPKLKPSKEIQLNNFHLLKTPFPLKSLSFSSSLQLPTSTLFNTPCSCTPQNHIIAKENNIHLLKRFAERLAILLVGSLLFMGRFISKPALALPSPPLEEKVDTQNGKSEDEELYMKLLEKNPRDVEALKVVLYGKMKKGKTKEAVKYVEKLIEVEPDEVEWRLLQALSYELMGQLTKAKRLFMEILEERPLLLRALHGLALVMHKNHEGQAVFDMLNKALEVAHSNQRVTEERNIKILIAQMHVIKGDLEEGLKRYNDLVNEDPRDFRPYLCQGIIYSLLDKKKEADEQFENYRSLVPQEFPQRGFLDDVILAAKTESQESLEKQFEDEFSYRK